jgi:hypothetical protein
MFPTFYRDKYTSKSLFVKLNYFVCLLAGLVFGRKVHAQ